MQVRRVCLVVADLGVPAPPQSPHFSLLVTEGNPAE